MIGMTERLMLLMNLIVRFLLGSYLRMRLVIQVIVIIGIHESYLYFYDNFYVRTLSSSGYYSYMGTAFGRTWVSWYT